MRSGLHDVEMAEELPAPKFRKTKTDKWAVMAPVATLEAALAGDGKVQVLKRSGDYSSFTVGSLGKPFDVDGVMMCYGYAPGDDDPQGAGGGSAGGGANDRGAGDRGASGAAPRRPAQTPRPHPTADPSEPLPEYRGGPEDEWSGDF